MSWLRRCLLRRINLGRPHAGKGIFYVRLSGCDKPQPIIHPLQQVRCGGNKHRHISHFSFCPPPRYLSLFLGFFCPPCHKLTLVSTSCSLTPISFSPFLFSLLRTEALPFSRRAPTSLKLWWMAPAPVSISKLKQFRDKTSRSLSYRFSPEFGLRWHLVSEWIREWKHGWTHEAALLRHDGAVQARRTCGLLNSKFFLCEKLMWLPKSALGPWSRPWRYTCVDAGRYIMEELCRLCWAVILYSPQNEVGNQHHPFTQRTSSAPAVDPKIITVSAQSL